MARNTVSWYPAATGAADSLHTTSSWCPKPILASPPTLLPQLPSVASLHSLSVHSMQPYHDHTEDVSEQSQTTAMQLLTKALVLLLYSTGTLGSCYVFYRRVQIRVSSHADVMHDMHCGHLSGMYGFVHLHRYQQQQSMCCKPQAGTQSRDHSRWEQMTNGPSVCQRLHEEHNSQ